MKMNFLSGVFFCLALSWANAEYKYKFLDPNVPWNDRVDDLIGRMTIEEMVNQTMASGVTQGIERLGVNPYPWGTECLRGHINEYATAFPQSLGLAATFRYSKIIRFCLA